MGHGTVDTPTAWRGAAGDHRATDRAEVHMAKTIEELRQDINSVLVSSERQLQQAKQQISKYQRENMDLRAQVEQVTKENDELVKMLDTERRDKLGSLENKFLRAVSVAVRDLKKPALPTATKRRLKKTAAPTAGTGEPPAPTADRTTCSVPWCQHPATGHGLCESHRQRWNKYGDPYLMRTRVNGVYTTVRETADGYELLDHPETTEAGTDV